MSTARRHKADVSLILLIGILLTVGLVVIYSISPILSHELLDGANRNYFVYGQLRHIAIGLVAFIVASQLPLKYWRKWLPAISAVTLFFLILMLIPQLGISEGGATRWLGVGGFSFQPVELVKFTVIIAAAAWFSGLKKEEIKSHKYALWPVMGLLAVVGLFILIHQRDLGSMLVIFGVVGAIFFTSGVQWQQMAALGGMVFAAGISSVILIPHRMQRLRTFFSPEDGLAESGYHLHQALIAVGSGGLFGVGLGKSVQVYGYLPEAANDSIFAIIGETFGLVGGFAVIALLGLVVYKCLSIASHTEDTFASFIALGVGVWIGVQSMVNIMAMIGVIPLTGITLPFLSYGGTSLVLVMLAMGVVVHISKYTVRKPYENSSNRRRDRRTHSSTLSSRASAH